MSLDAAIEPQAQAALDSISGVRDLVVERTPSGLMISGSVPSYYYKQLAQEAVMAVAGGLQVVNSVQVDSEQQE